MAILHDLHDFASIEFKFVHHIPGEHEGSKLQITFMLQGKLYEEFTIGWANITTKNYIQLLKAFPGEKYDRWFTHFEEPLEMQWLHEHKTDLYILYFSKGGLFFPPIKANQNDLHRFGTMLEQEMHQAPDLDLDGL